jgi:hypothetical protein
MAKAANTLDIGIGGYLVAIAASSGEERRGRASQRPNEGPWQP